jgi:uncharacterized protein YdhG (YjbR/CyaY superfamily)
MSLKKTKHSEAVAANAYIASLPDDARKGLRKLRSAIAAAIPGATLGISYGIPAFKLNGRPVVWFASFKQHSSFFPGAAAILNHVADLKGYKTSKGTIQFPPDRPLPAKLVATLVKTRMADMQKKRR